MRDTCRGRIWVRAATVPGVVLLQACADQRTGATDYQLGDTLVVESMRPVIADTLELREVDRIGQFDGPPEYLFTNVYAFAAGFDGSLFVHDNDDGIRQFDPEGRYVRHLAGPGQGPREVGYLLGMDVDSAGHLAAVDLANARVSIFDVDGDDVTVFPRPNLRARYGDGSIRFDSDGTLWIGVHPATPSSGGIPHPRLAFLQYSVEGDLLSEGEYRMGFWEDRREPFLPKTTWAIGPDGSFAIGCPEDYVLDVHQPDADIVRIHRSWDPLLMTDEARERMRRQSGLNPPPRRRPAYARIILPGDGRVWVWPNQPMEQIELSQEDAAAFGRTYAMRISTRGAFDVFTEEGRWLATVKMPDEAPFSGFPTEPSVLIRGDTIWALATDELDVQYVVRYEVPGLDGMSK